MTEPKARFEDVKEENKTSYFKDFTESERIEYWNMYGDLLSTRLSYKGLSQEAYNNKLVNELFTNREKEVMYLNEEAFKELLFKLLAPEDLDAIFYPNYGYVSDWKVVEENAY